MPAKRVKKLDLTDCNKIIVSYQTVLKPEYGQMSWFSRNVAWLKSDMSTFRYFITGTFYCGELSRFWFTDFFAGGATNNFALNCSSHNYGNFIYFINALCTHVPSNPDTPFDANKILVEIEAAINTKDDEAFKTVVEKYKQYVPTKCYYDLKADIEGNADYYNSGDRQVETQSRRWSKLLSIGYAACQGAIEVMGIKCFSFFVAFVAMGLGIPAAAFVALVAFSINYAVSRKYTNEMLDKLISGHFFKRNVGTEEAPDYQSFNKIEIVSICLFSILPSLLAVAGVYLLGASSVIALPWLLAGALPLSLVMPFVMIFSHSPYKFIEEKGLEKLKDYFFEHFYLKNWYDFSGYAKILFWEIPKIAISLLISGVIFYANYGMLFGKSLYLLGAAGAAIAAGAYAGVKSLFCVSKTSEVIASSSDTITNYLFDRDVNKEKKNDVAPCEIKNTRQIHNVLQTSASRCEDVTAGIKLVTLAVHCGSEAGLVIESPTGNKGEAVVKALYSFFTSVSAIFKAKHNPKTDTVNVTVSRPAP